MVRHTLIVVLGLLLVFPALAQDAVDLTCGQVTIDDASAGDSFTATCPAGCSEGSIWGTDIYTSDSDICTAAAHAGVIDLEDGGTFELLYIDGQDDHPASEQNGITSSSWPSWFLSFTFESSSLQLTCGQSTIEGAEAGDSITATCPAACSEGSIWGTDIYTDDSDICTAAAHAGVIDLVEGGTFELLYVDGQEDHPASEQNGITSSSWPSWPLSFTFEGVGAIPLNWETTANLFEGDPGDYGLVSCPANGDTNPIWGTDIYTDDSSICSAAVHAGLISVADGGVFIISILEGQDSYESTEQNGINSGQWPEWPRSFALTPELLDVEWDTAADELPGIPGTTYMVMCPEDGVGGSIWGTDIYTDDSSVCTAAVHAGIIDFDDGGIVIVGIFEGQSIYEASSQNDVESREWPEWERSFVVDR